MRAPSYGLSTELVSREFQAVRCESLGDAGGFILENAFYRAVVDPLARVTSFVLKASQR